LLVLAASLPAREQAGAPPGAPRYGHISIQLSRPPVVERVQIWRGSLEATQHPHPGPEAMSSGSPWELEPAINWRDSIAHGSSSLAALAPE